MAFGSAGRLSYEELYRNTRMDLQIAQSDIRELKAQLQESLKREKHLRERLDIVERDLAFRRKQSSIITVVRAQEEE